MPCPQVRITAMLFSCLVLVILLFFLGFSLGNQTAWSHQSMDEVNDDDSAFMSTPIP